MQVEYATDLACRSPTTLGLLYEQFVRCSVSSVKAEQIATVPGRQTTPRLAQGLGSHFATSIVEAVSSGRKTSAEVARLFKIHRATAFRMLSQARAGL